jgi:chromosome partitioning protein
MAGDETGAALRQAHVIVCGNEKGGSGKTTTAMHLAIALLQAGQRVATIDFDSRQLSLSRYVANRVAWSMRHGRELPIPDHYRLKRAGSDSIERNETEELALFQEILSAVEYTHDFILIDTPGNDTFAMRLAHFMADTLITPINDSYVDFDVLADIDPETGDVTGVSHYASIVRDARRQRRAVDNGLLDWVVVRNRLSPLPTRNQRRLDESLRALAMHMGCRLAGGISERVVFRELFPLGLTALDDAAAGLSVPEPSLSHLSARQEVRALLSELRLPIDAAGRRRIEARRQWLEADGQVADDLDIFAA